MDPNQAYLVLGMSLVTLFTAQLLLGLRWEWLVQLQADEVYRQITGYLLLAYILLQSRLGIKRLCQHLNSLRKEFDSHKIQGVFAPVLFYIHSTEVGFAYQMFFAFVFLGNCIVGYMNPHALKCGNRLYLMSWTITHISLAILTLALMSFHIFVVYTYS